jgi:hypothetical protein
MTHVAQVRANKNTYMVLLVETGRKRLVRTCCCKWEYTTKLYLKESGRVWLGFISSQHCANMLAVLNTTMNLQVTCWGADNSLARPGRKQATATEDFEFQVSYL